MSVMRGQCTAFSLFLAGDLTQIVDLLRPDDDPCYILSGSTFSFCMFVLVKRVIKNSLVYSVICPLTKRQLVSYCL